MQYFSLNNNAKAVGFEKAVRSGLAPDRGLYYPQQINQLKDSFWDNFLSMSHNEIALAAIEQFVGDEIPKQELQKIIEDTLTFPFPVVEFNENLATLELFHGPTMAFKDVGGRFMARCLGYFNRTSTEKVTVLVATSGDTGGAVASGFLGVPGVEVVILYPKGKVSHIQELQLTTQGQNITSLEVDGVFDDCQEMVKTAFLDETLKPHRNLTSANSINVARWLPQSFYYFFAVQELMKRKVNNPFVFSVPSGNFGNICAGFIARELGLPISHFIASTNQNDTFPDIWKMGSLNQNHLFKPFQMQWMLGIRVILIGLANSSIKIYIDSRTFVLLIVSLTKKQKQQCKISTKTLVIFQTLMVLSGIWACRNIVKIILTYMECF